MIQRRSVSKESIRAAMAITRRRTLELLNAVPDEYLRRRVHDFYSPIGWHFGHVGRTEEFWVCGQALGRLLVDDHLSWRFADVSDNPKDDRVDIPDRAGILEYLAQTRARVLEALETVDFSEDNPFLAEGYAWNFALEHECQHQETICEMLYLIQQDRWRNDELPVSNCLPEPSALPPLEWDLFSGGECVFGTDERCVYDNEGPAFRGFVEPFQLASRPVVVDEWRQFIAADGYLRQEFWSERGWQWCQSGAVVAPQYWVDERGVESIALDGIRCMEAEEPVQGISHFEAEAFANWFGARLPTEFEWEFAAKQSGGPFPWGEGGPPLDVDFGGLGRQPRRLINNYGGLAGGVWEWTSSPFLPYKGFRAFPYDGYSKDHMDGFHFVCRGGSWATALPILRSTFRNWYVPGYRQGFLGLRLACTPKG
jgi:gamma-glutamyl hercynylcysteine S-oxide synthase